MDWRHDSEVSSFAMAGWIDCPVVATCNQESSISVSGPKDRRLRASGTEPLRPIRDVIAVSKADKTYLGSKQ